MLQRLKSLFKKKSKIMKVWNIEAGPFYLEGGCTAVTARVEIEGIIYYSNIQFEDKESLDVFTKHFQSSIEPLEIEL